MHSTPQVQTVREADTAGNCPLCSGLGQPYYEDRQRPAHYFRCPDCELIWLDPKNQLSAGAEKAHYEQHQNCPSDPGYRAFLNRIWEPLKSRLAPGASGLDFGSGPGPTLHLMVREDGFACEHYDPYFHPVTKHLKPSSYDFITCSETAEHFRAPGAEFNRLAALLRPGGDLAVMTRLHCSTVSFASWHYRQDHSHVSFYNRRSFQQIAKQSGFSSVSFLNDSVTILKKQN